jgi:hypothetical protein
VLESAALPGDGEVLAGGTACDKINVSCRPPPVERRRLRVWPPVDEWLNESHASYVVCDGHPWEPCSEHVPPVAVGFAHEQVPEPGEVEAVVESSDSGEEADAGEISTAGYP